jgi:hypothetical protein
MMKNNIIILLICSLFLPLAGKGQINLVLNPQFEQYSTCPDNWDEAKYANHWMSLDSAWSPPDWAHDPPGVPDYCNVCATSYRTTIPNNMFFRRNARSGNGMMQVQMYTFFATTSAYVARDYLQGHLSQTLLAGHKYNVKFYATLEQGGSYAINNIGAYLDDGTIDTTHNPGRVQSQYTPQIVDTNIINDTLNWIKIEDTFVSNGTEKLITIGQFTDSAHTNYIALPITVGGAYTWYLIEDVSVIDCDNIPHAGNDTVIHLSDSAFIGTHEPLLPYKWYKLGTTTVIDSTGGIWVKPTVTTSYVVEQMLCGVKRWDTVKVWVWPDTPSSVGNLQLAINSSMVYPNPVTRELTITGAKGFDIVLFDVVGRELLRRAIVTDKQAIDMADLPKGIYLVELVDKLTGMKLVRSVLKE